MGIVSRSVARAMTGDMVNLGPRARGLLWAGVTVVLWGALPLVLKLLVVHQEPSTLTWYRFLAAGCFLAPAVWRRSGKRALGQLGGRYLVLGLICVGGLCGNYLTYLSGLKYIGPETAQVVMQLTPVLVLLGGLLVFKEAFSRLQWLGLGALLVGMALFLNQRLGDLGGDLGPYLWGLFLTVLAAVMWTAFILAQKPLLHRLPSAVLLFGVYAVGTLVFMPFARMGAVLGLEGLQLGLLGVAIVTTLVSYLSFAAAVKFLEASRVGAILALGPLSTMVCMGLVEAVWPNVQTYEPLNAPGYLGAVLVVAGSMSCSLGRQA